MKERETESETFYENKLSDWSIASIEQSDTFGSCYGRLWLGDGHTHTHTHKPSAHRDTTIGQ